VIEIRRSEECQRCQLFSGFLGDEYPVCGIYSPGPAEIPCLDFAEVTENIGKVNLHENVQTALKKLIFGHLDKYGSHFFRDSDHSFSNINMQSLNLKPYWNQVRSVALSY
jgi:hypothetical protein